MLAHAQSVAEVNQFQQNNASRQIRQLHTGEALNSWRSPNTTESPPGYELSRIWICM